MSARVCRELQIILGALRPRRRRRRALVAVNKAEVGLSSASLTFKNALMRPTQGCSGIPVEPYNVVAN